MSITKTKPKAVFKHSAQIAISLLATISSSSFAIDQDRSNTSANGINNATSIVSKWGNQTTDQIIVKFKANSQAHLNMQNDQLVTSSIGQEVSFIRATALNSAVYKLDRKISLSEITSLIQTLQKRSDVEYVEADALMEPMLTPNDSRYNEQWHYFEATGGLNLPQAWDQTAGQGAVVAVLDTGYRPHVDLNDNLLPGYDMITNTFVSRDGNGRDADARDPGDWTTAGECGNNYPPSDRSSSWHGTHVAGTVAAETNNSQGVAGVAYQAKIVPVRVLGRCGGYLSDIADAIIWAAGGNVSGVPNNANPANVINLSLGGSGACGTTYQNAINFATGQDTSVIVSAGNSNANASNFRPANCNGVVTVAATGRNGGKAYYSNFGATVEVAAPGGAMGPNADGVLSTLNTGNTTPANDNYAFYQGTSMAAPHVAGVAALLYSINPNLSTVQVTNTLQNTARNFPATCSQCGSGIVNALAAVNAISGGSNLVSGNMTLDHNWKTQAFSGPSTPRVVMGTPSYNGSHPSTIRVNSVTTSSFATQIDEWDYLDGSHTTENISYLIAQNGNSNFGSLSVKSGATTLNQNWKTVNYGSAFSNTPVVVAQVVTVNGSAAVTTRIRNVTSTSFQIRLQEEENADGTHNTETVHWIAIESGTTTVNGSKLVVGRTSNSVTDAWSTINYSSVTNPRIIAAMQTFDGGDSAVLRRRNLTATSVQVKVEEEQSKDSETAHTTEVVGYILMGN